MRTTTKDKLGSMFVIEDTVLSVTLGEVCYSGDHFRTLARETRQGETKELKRGDAPSAPASSKGAACRSSSAGNNDSSPEHARRDGSSPDAAALFSVCRQ